MSATVATGAPDTTVADEAAGVPHPGDARRTARAVLLPLVVSRLLVLGALALGAVGTGQGLGAALEGADGFWYLRIAEQGYGTWEHWTSWPFFPLFPGLLGAARAFGIPAPLAGFLLNAAALGIGAWGVHRLASRRMSPRGAGIAVWVLAVFPGSWAFSLLYPSALFLALSVWAFAFAEDERDTAAAVCACGAVLVRPNGIAVAIALLFVVGAWARRLRLAGPAFVAFGGWLAALGLWTGNPLIFATSKHLWNEVTLPSLLGSRRDTGTWMHFLVGLSGWAVVASERRRMPTAWFVFASLYVLPSLALGIVGMARYGAECFPVCLAVAAVLDRYGDRALRAVVAIGAVLLLLMSLQIGAGRWTP